MDGLLLFKFVRYLEHYKGCTLNKILSDGKGVCLSVYFRNRNENIAVDLVEGGIFFPESFDGNEFFSKLNGSTIINLKQRGYDRVFYIQVSKRKASGAIEYFKLVFELVGGNSNFFILDENAVILYTFSNRNIDPDRVLKVGQRYHVFKSNKSCSLDNYGDQKDFNQFEGFYKKTADFANRLIGINGDFDKTVEYIKKFLFDNKVYIDETGKLYPFKINDHLDELDISDYKLIKKGNKNISYNGVIQRIKEKIEKKEELLKKIKTELAFAENYREFLEKAELIKNNLFRIDEAINTGEFLKFTDQGEERIFLDLKGVKDIDEYIENLFNKGKKLERSIHIIRKRVSDIENEIRFYKELLYYIEQGEIDYDDIDNLLRPEQKLKQGKIKKQKRYLKYKKGQFTILIGKNSFGNNEILSISDRNDLWFHVQGAPSSHVILKRDKELPSYDMIVEICSITAFFSPLSNENKVPVDWTEKKYVKKVKGAAKGFVIYDNFKTLLVHPASPEELGFSKENM